MNMKALSCVLILFAIVKFVRMEEEIVSKVECSNQQTAEWMNIMLSYPYECFDPQFFLEILTCYDGPRNTSFGEHLNKCAIQSYSSSGVVCRSDCPDMMNKVTVMAVQEFDFKCENDKFLESFFTCLLKIRQGAECPENGYSSCAKPFE
ncbi:uncharacterized protein LOC116171815 [Photinus pyralis]|uniref:Uncharacterized protein n=1 Tax=Photinus pyralis TaxID=7054 RepID=A0A1Y1M946_PHOPY|nr:uncharacterized protein LOC116171815 [Photinus pyralis]